MSESERGDRDDRRSPGNDRRTYNRRSQSAAVSPPYYEAFERIAVAIEGIATQLSQRQVTLPDAERGSAVSPRRSPEQQKR